MGMVIRVLLKKLLRKKYFLVIRSGKLQIKNKVICIVLLSKIKIIQNHNINRSIRISNKMDILNNKLIMIIMNINYFHK